MIDLDLTRCRLLVEDENMSVHDITRAGTERATDDNVLTWLARLDTSGRNWEAQLAPVSMELVDALVHADPQALQQLGDPIRDTLAKHFDGSGYAREAPVRHDGDEDACRKPADSRSGS